MLYCSSCQYLCPEAEPCPNCDRPAHKLRLPLENDPVYLYTANPGEAFLTESILTEENIPFLKSGNHGAGAVLYASVHETYRFYVPYGAYKKSRALVAELQGGNNSEKGENQDE